MKNAHKIYLAGSCSSERRTVMQSVAKQLRDNGYDVYCPFELNIPNAWDMPQEDWAQKVFDADVEALDACDLVLMISPGRISSAGTNWEQGYAFAKKKRIIVIQCKEASTSLMTYCGSNRFINCSEADLMNDVMSVINTKQGGCKTILT